jgi:metal transporter CNNM
MQYVSVFIQVAVLVMLAAICSGLNISLMSLSLGDLRRKAKLGNRAAQKVLPLRRDAHLSLAAILFSNMAVVSGSSLLLEHHFNGWIAGIATTLLMVVFGEVLPQAAFIRSALKTCAFFAPLIRVMIIVAYPVAKPLALLPDHHRYRQRTD